MSMSQYAEQHTGKTEVSPARMQLQNLQGQTARLRWILDRLEV